MKRRHGRALGVWFLILVVVTGVFLFLRRGRTSLLEPLISKTPEQLAKEYTIVESTPQPTPLPSPTPTPTPKPLTFAEKNALYGPCVVLPTLMYHHVQDLGVAKTEGHAQLTVDTKIFRSQMQYLKDKGYTVIPMTSLIVFFDNGTPVPKKSILLTFDDGYDDFATDAAPVLSEFGFPSTLFVPTGLVENPGYLHWSTIMGLRGSNVLMANHTWSHHNMGASKPVIEKEIMTADTQLTDHGLNSPKTFAYPYGLTSPAAISFLAAHQYEVAFTTVYGNTLCKQQRLILPRMRIGNASLSTYGL